jgi:hypothetical protein
MFEGDYHAVYSLKVLRLKLSHAAISVKGDFYG